MPLDSVSETVGGSTESERPPSGLDSRWALGVALAALIAACALLQGIGVTSREFPRSAQRIQADGTRDAFLRLWETGARGRVVVMLSSTTRVTPMTSPKQFVYWLDNPTSDPPVGDTDYLEALFASGIAREVILVVPDNDWNRFSKPLKARFDVISEAPRFHSRFYGAPLVYTRMKDLALPNEPVVVDIAGDMLDAPLHDELEALAEQGKADIVLLEGR